MVKNQSIFEFHDVEGTIVGFRCPSYVSAVNVAGYHLHFITRAQERGGHLLECQMQNAEIEIDDTPGFYMLLPQSEEFYKLDLTDRGQSEMDKVEKGSN